MGNFLQRVRWPGVAAVESFRYECNHGISPNVAVLTTYPQAAKPLEFGNLEFGGSDGKLYAIRGCRAKKMSGVYSSSGGQTWTLYILDPRWMWMSQFGGLSGITGWYNRKDARGELIPWTIRSAEELCKLCLDQMGVTNYRIRAPQGYTSKDAGKLTQRLFLGERFKPSGTNIEFVFDHTPPAEALSQICQRYGLRVVYQPLSELVIITPPGEGRNLPLGPVEMEAPNVTLPETPVAVAAYGDAVRIQVRLGLEPIAKEWHGWPVPADTVSYAPPQNAGDKGRTDVIHTGTVYEALVRVSWTDSNGGKHSVEAWSFDTSSIASQLNEIALILNQNPEFSSAFTATVSGSTLQIQSNIAGQQFDVFAGRLDIGISQFQTEYNVVVHTRPGSPTDADWGYSAPPVFPTVRPTDRLSYTEARSLARESVFRWYRIKMVTVGEDKGGGSEVSTSLGLGQLPNPQLGTLSQTSTSQGARTEEKFPKPGKVGKKDGLWIPWYSERYGLVKRREQLIILSSKVEQVTPKPRIEGGQNQGNTIPASVASGILPEAYMGTSRDQEMTVKGSVYSGLGSVNWTRLQEVEPGPPVANNQSIPLRPMNTKRTDRVYVPFQIQTLVNGEQIVVFNEPVYYWNKKGDTDARYDFPELTLETSINIRHPISDMPIRWEEQLPIPGGTTPIEWHENNELAVGVVGIYDDKNNLIDWMYGSGDIEYTRAAASFFLKSKAARFYIKGGITKQFPEIIPIEPDGYIQQVSWSIGSGGPTTIASTNSEHSAFWPDYPQRVRAELLAPNKMASEANMKERVLVDKWNQAILNSRKS